MIGGIVAKRMRFTDPKDLKKVVGFGALGAILALFVGPILSGSLQLGTTPDAIEVDQLGWAIVVAIIVAVVVTLARTVAAVLARATGGGPHLPILIAAALIVGFSALIVQSRTGESIVFIVTSGEEFITKLPALTSASTVLAIIIFKAIAYAVSLGSGFRGGPFFPAMFIGAAVGLLISLAMGDSGPSVPAAIVVGVIASLVATAPMKWPIVIILGVVLGLMMGTWTLVPAALVGAVVARLIPRWGDRHPLVASASTFVRGLGGGDLTFPTKSIGLPHVAALPRRPGRIRRSAGGWLARHGLRADLLHPARRHRPHARHRLGIGSYR
jgi:H+/Cl- antiporter ClcA